MTRSSGVSFPIRKLITLARVDSPDQFRARVGELVLVGAPPAAESGSAREGESWSFVTRHVPAGLTDDPEAFRDSTAWPLKKKQGLLSGLLANTVTVGRTETNDIPIQYPSLSKIHARFRWRASAWEVCDAKSMNGTTLNGDALPPDEFVGIKSGDRICFGDVNCRLYNHERLQRILKFMAPEDNVEQL